MRYPGPDFSFDPEGNDLDDLQKLLEDYIYDPNTETQKELTELWN